MARKRSARRPSRKRSRRATQKAAAASRPPWGMIALGAAAVGAVVFFWPQVSQAMGISSTSTQTGVGGTGVSPLPHPTGRTTGGRTGGGSGRTGGTGGGPGGSQDAGVKTAGPGAPDVTPPQPDGGFFSGIGNWFANAQQAASVIPGL